MFVITWHLLFVVIIKHNGSNQGLTNVECAGFKETKGIKLSLNLFPGEFHPVLKSNSQLAGVPTTQLMCFPEFVSPSDERNDIYISLVGVSGMKVFAPKNVLCQVQVFLEGSDKPQV